MSGADYFDVVPLNPYSHGHSSINRDSARADFAKIKAALEQAGIEIIQKDPPPGCQDGIFTANWGICRGDTVVLSSLPPDRAGEQPYAEAILKDLGKKIIKAPYRFSGQGDALPCGDVLFAGAGFRTDQRMHEFLSQALGYKVVSLETVPLKDSNGRIVVNQRTGWPDSYFYDLDLALSILRPNMIAWCPEAFTEQSQATIRALDQFKKIEVSYEEDVKRFDCNLISTGSTVIMSAHAPLLKAALEQHDFKVITVDAPELAKGGGGIRCCALTLDNE